MADDRDGIDIGGEFLPHAEYAESAKLVGNFMLHVSIFDIMISELVCALHDIDTNTRNVGLVHHVPLQTKLEILKGISKRLAEGWIRTTLRDLAQRAELPIQKRNLAAHGLLDIQDGEIIYHSMTSTRKLKVDQDRQVLFARDLPALTTEVEALIELATSTSRVVQSNNANLRASVAPEVETKA